MHLQVSAVAVKVLLGETELSLVFNVSIVTMIIRESK